MFALTVIVCGGLLLAGTAVALVAAIRAPVGYENGQGFFEGIEPPPQEIPATAEAALPCAADRAPEDGLGSYEDVEPWPPQVRRAMEPILSAQRASSHVHGVR